MIVSDPMYLAYEGLIAATGATAITVPLQPELGFRLQASDVATRITQRTRVVLLTTPHNPTGVVLRKDEIAALGALAIEHNLWIVADEV